MSDSSARKSPPSPQAGPCTTEKSRRQFTEH
jgi:hypothetical protein